MFLSNFTYSPHPLLPSDVFGEVGGTDGWEKGREGTVGAEEIGQVGSLCGLCTLPVGCAHGPCCVDPTRPLSSRSSHSKWEDLEQISGSWGNNRYTDIGERGGLQVGPSWCVLGEQGGSSGLQLGHRGSRLCSAARELWPERISASLGLFLRLTHQQFCS